MINASLAIEVYVLEKSMPLVCAKPFATILCLVFIHLIELCFLLLIMFLESSIVKFRGLEDVPLI